MTRRLSRCFSRLTRVSYWSSPSSNSTQSSQVGSAHCAFTYLAISKGGNAFTLLINGVQVDSGSSSQNVLHAGTMSAKIGGRNGTSPFYFDGIIDEVLTAAEK